MLGRTSVPSIPRKTATECGLMGLAGLNIDYGALSYRIVYACGGLMGLAGLNFDYGARMHTRTCDAMRCDASVLNCDNVTGSLSVCVHACAGVSFNSVLSV